MFSQFDTVWIGNLKQVSSSQLTRCYWQELKLKHESILTAFGWFHDVAYLSLDNC